MLTSLGWMRVPLQERFSEASILEVLSANLDCGARVVLEAVGPDEKEPLSELEALLQRSR